MIHQRHRQTDGQTTCDIKTALCTIVHPAVKTIKSKVSRPFCSNLTGGHVLASLYEWTDEKTQKYCKYCPCIALHLQIWNIIGIL